MILTFFLLSLLVLFLDQWTGGWTTMHLFCVYRSSLKDPLFYIRLFGHVLGHAGWEHFLNNMLLLLVVGPPMEEKYGSKALLGGIVFTALVTGVLQCVLFPRTGLLGASGIVFMLIMLSSLAGFSGGIPVTMLLVAALYFGQQVYDILLAANAAADPVHRTETVNGKYSIKITRPPGRISADAERFCPNAYKHIDILGKYVYDTGTGSEQTGNMQKEEPVMMMSSAMCCPCCCSMCASQAEPFAAGCVVSAPAQQH